jgi:hypothetical protein
MKLRTDTQLDKVFQQDTWRVCSALVADTSAHAGVIIKPSAFAANLISPDDLYRRILSQS